MIIVIPPPSPSWNCDNDYKMLRKFSVNVKLEGRFFEGYCLWTTSSRVQILFQVSWHCGHRDYSFSYSKNCMVPGIKWGWPHTRQNLGGHLKPLYNLPDLWWRYFVARVKKERIREEMGFLQSFRDIEEVWWKDVETASYLFYFNQS